MVKNIMSRYAEVAFFYLLDPSPSGTYDLRYYSIMFHNTGVTIIFGIYSDKVKSFRLIDSRMVMLSLARGCIYMCLLDISRRSLRIMCALIQEPHRILIRFFNLLSNILPVLGVFSSNMLSMVNFSDLIIALLD